MEVRFYIVNMENTKINLYLIIQSILTERFDLNSLQKSGKKIKTIFDKTRNVGLKLDKINYQNQSLAVYIELYNRNHKLK